MRRKSTYGFTLIEMLVATVLLAIGVTASLGAISAATNAEAEAHRIQTASMLARQKLADLAVQGLNGQLSAVQQQGTFAPDEPDYHWSENSISTQYTNLFEVTVTVTWGSGNDQHQTAITTYMQNVDQGTLNSTNQSSPSSSTSGGFNGL